MIRHIVILLLMFFIGFISLYFASWVFSDVPSLLKLVLLFLSGFVVGIALRALAAWMYDKTQHLQ